MAITLSKEVKDQIRAHAVRDYPFECCGFLFGHVDTQQRTIIKSKPVENVEEAANKKRNFEISSEAYMKAEEEVEQEGMVLAGIYHSHPDHPAVPSQSDLKKALPFFSYVIMTAKVSEIGSLKSWYLNDDGKFEEEEVTIKDEQNSLNP